MKLYTVNGYIEHDADEIYNNLISTIKDLKEKLNEIPEFISITNQRETIVVFDRIREYLNEHTSWKFEKRSKIMQ